MTDSFLAQKQAFFDKWASFYDFFLTTVIYQAIHQRLLAYVTLPNYAKVLDLGCGTGRLLNRLAAQYPNLWGMGLDLSPKMIQQARKSNTHPPQLIFLEGMATDLPCGRGQFDAVFNTISFLHYQHPQLVLSEIQRVLRPDGRFYLVDYTVSESGIFPVSPSGIRLYSPKKREEMGQSVGLACLGHHYLLGQVLLTIFQASE